MIVWIVLSSMAAVAALLVATPFIKSAERRRVENAFDVAAYRDQIKEIELEASQGALDAAQAEAAKSEIKRRVLARAQDDGAQKPDLSGGERVFAAVGVAGVVVLGAIGLFALTANLESLAGRGEDDVDQAAESSNEVASKSTAEAKPARSAAATVAAGSAGRPGGKSNALPPVDELIGRLAKRLEANPKDVAGWKMLGWSYTGVERYGEAADAYGKAIALAPNVAEFHSARAESLIRAGGGSVGPEAKKLIEETLEIDPKDARARYYKGVIKEQDGDKSGALAEWRQLVADSDSNEPFVQELKQKIASAENPATAGAAPIAAPAPPAASAPSDKGPTAQDVKNAEAMPPADRMAMIRGMVDALAARLEKSPHDAEGWIKLIRSRSVLKDSEQAKQSLDRALKAFEGENAERDRILAAARDVGLTP
jgi:cytochrome c-type biogenesis protein CcmH